MRSALQNEFENFINRNAPSFFDVNVSRAARHAAFNRVLGTPDAVLSTPQERLLYTLNYQSGSTTRAYSPDIPKSLYPYWILKLSGALGKTEGAPGTLPPEGPLPLIGGFRVLVDGAVVKEIDLMHLRVLSHHIGRGIDTNMVPISLGTDVGEPFSARIALDWRTLRSEKPDATFFPADRYNQLSVEVDWGAITTTTIPSMISGGTYTGVAFSVNPTLQIIGKEILDPAKRAAPYWLQRYSQKVFGVNAQAQVAASYQLPIGEIIRGILISQYINNPRTPLATLIPADNQIKLRANGTYFKYETTWGELVNKNQADYGIALPTGYAFIDFMDPDNGGLYESAFRTDSGISTLEALVDTASIANAFLQFTMVTFAPAKNF